MAVRNNYQQHVTPSNIPIPDPSAVTVDLINRAIDNLRNETKDATDAQGLLRESELGTLRVRLDSMDKAAVVLASDFNRVPTILDREITRLEKLFEERFRSVALQFIERDVRATASETAAKEAQGALSTAGTTAVNAALQAQKESAFATQQSNAEAIRKSEAGFTNEINSLKFLINATKETLTGGIGDLRSRIDVGGGANVGSREERDSNHQSLIGTLGVVGGFVSIATLIAMVIFGLQGSNHGISSNAPTIVSPAVIPVAPR